MKSYSLIRWLVIISLTLAVVPLSNARDAKDSANALPLQELRNFSDIFDRVKSDYVEKVDDKTLFENAIRGILSGLDPHSAYLDPQEYKELRIGTTGQFGGLGIQVGLEDGFVKVISPIDDTPAFRAGIKAGDMIIRLDNKPVKGMPLDEAVGLMRGKPGTEITLTVVRDGVKDPLTFKIKRAVINVKSVKSRLLEKDYGYVRISTFQSHTPQHLRDAMARLKKENQHPLNGLILDLRNNPGGVLDAAAQVSDMFLTHGMIVYTKGRIKDAYFEYHAKPGDVLKNAPMVVLINEGSASASEIVAGALQDHHRAIIMGSQSFGKGSVQTIQELRNGGAIKLTTARYFTPNGRSIQAEGIIPDIKLEAFQLTPVENATNIHITEADLDRHLANPNGDSDKPSSQDNGKANEKIDYATREALNLLKGLNLYTSQAKAKEK